MYFHYLSIVVLHPTQYLYDLNIFAFDLRIIDQGKALLKKVALSDSDSFKSDDSSEEKERMLNPRGRRESKLVKASYPLNRPNTPQTTTGGIQDYVIVKKVTGLLSKAKQVWDQCCLKHFPPIKRVDDVGG